MKTLHPLINPNSAGHYDNGSITTIEKMEARLSVTEMIGFAKGNAFKYEERKELKGQLEADIEKIKTYKNYLEVLIKLKRDGMSGFLVCDALKQARYEFVYRASDLVEKSSLF